MPVEIEREGSVRILRMNAGENRFNRPMVDAIVHALDEVEKDRSARAAVFTGAHEKYFSNGLDLNWILSSPREEWTPFILDFDMMLHRAFTFPKPVVAAMNGHAFAGGLFLALCADWRVMRRDRGWCCVPEIDLHLGLPPGNIALIAYAVGWRKADFLSLTGRRLTAEESVEIGLVDEAADKEDVLPRALSMAAELAAKDQSQYASHKRGLRAWAARALKDDDPVFFKELLALDTLIGRK